MSKMESLQGRNQVPEHEREDVLMLTKSYQMEARERGERGMEDRFH